MGGLFKSIGGFFGDIFGSDAAPAASTPAASIVAPTPEAPKVMPIPDDKATKLANQRKLALNNQRRTSRDSTILTDNTDLLGG